MYACADLHFANQFWVSPFRNVSSLNLAPEEIRPTQRANLVDNLPLMKRSWGLPKTKRLRRESLRIFLGQFGSDQLQVSGIQPLSRS
jgi:hypothetical protein